MIKDLIVPQLLQKLRSEIQQTSFLRLKETEIYRIHQSTDVANLEGLDDSALKLFPSLLKLQNSLYSSTFRTYLFTVTGSGLLW